MQVDGYYRETVIQKKEKDMSCLTSIRIRAAILSRRDLPANAKLLLAAIDTFGQAGLKLSNSAIADLLGISPAAVKRALAYLAGRHLIRIHAPRSRRRILYRLDRSDNLAVQSGSKVSRSAGTKAGRTTGFKVRPVTGSKSSRKTGTKSSRKTRSKVRPNGVKNRSTGSKMTPNGVKTGLTGFTMSPNSGSQTHTTGAKVSHRIFLNNIIYPPLIPPQGGRVCEDALFEQFWQAYPRKTAKLAAQRAFGKLSPDAGMLAGMLEALERQKASADWQREGGRFIPYPARWLSGRRWEDEWTPDPMEGLTRAVSQEELDRILGAKWYA
jgi:hypothetical protein